MAFHKAKALQEAEKSVNQGKFSQAIRQYQEILDNDPADVSLLNTLGDLYVKERNINEGLKQFHRLAEAFVREGFNVKAIAIYKKITKVDPNPVETLLKLAELYQLQGLSREAREQYFQAAEYFKKRNQAERALDVLRKLVQLDPDNINFRNRLAQECEQAGKREDAAVAQLEIAEILLRRDDQASAESALAKAAELDPKNIKAGFLRARAAIARHDPEQAERIINASPQLQADPTGKRILLDSYVALHRLVDAKRLVTEVFLANPADFAPIAAVTGLLVENGDIQEAYEMLAGVSETLVVQHAAGPLIEALRRVSDSAPNHLPTLELLHAACERTADEFALPEVLERLGHAYEQAGNTENAEAVYLKLVAREPENEHFRALLGAVQQKLGKEIKPIEPPVSEMPLQVEEAPPPPPADAGQDAMVKEAFENSDLFCRYNLTDKAIAELEKVLQVYPDQIEIHRRILEIAHKGFPERAAAAAGHLARIYSEQGDEELAGKYRAIASAKGAMHELPSPTPLSGKQVEQAAPSRPPSATPAAPEEFPLLPITLEAASAEAAPAPMPVPPAPAEASFDLTPPALEPAPADAPAAPPEPAGEELELDLSEELAAFDFARGSTAETEAAAAPAAELPPPAKFSPPEESSVLTEQTLIPPAEPAKPETAAGPAEPIPLSDSQISAAEQPAQPPVFVDETIPEAPVVAEDRAATAAEPEHPGTKPIPAGPTHPAEEPIPADLEDSRIEVEFYLENGFIEEARQAVATLEHKYPSSTLVSDLRRRVNERSAGAPTAPTTGEVLLSDEDLTATKAAPKASAEEPRFEDLGREAQVEPQLAGGEPPASAAIAGPPLAAPLTVPVEEEDEEGHEEWELPTAYAAATADTIEGQEVAPVVEQDGAVAQTEEHPSEAEVAATEVPTPPLESELPAASDAHEFAIAENSAAEAPSADILDDLAGELASSLEGMPEAVGISGEGRTDLSATSFPPDTPEGAAQLSGLLAEIEDPDDAATAAKHDPETHYNLGVAFREMGLLDEAIGEFQKVVKGVGKANFPTNFLQACSLLAICFMDKQMPGIAIKWYRRALETPGLDEEASLALQYDLGLAYEQAGDSRNALESFTEVYSQNIDFRDVADKIRELQQKV